MNNYISLEEALGIVQDQVVKPKTEKIKTERTLGRVSAQNIISPFDMPAFNKATMDGFAYSSLSGQKSYRIVGESKAGGIKENNFDKKDCIRIMTGAFVPKPFDKVIRVEFTKQKGELVSFIKDEPTDNISKKCSYSKKGETLLYPPLKISPQIIGQICGLGYSNISVFKKPKVGILTLGDELLHHSQKMKNGKIFDSNLPMLTAQSTNIGAKSQNYPIMKDNRLEIEQSLKLALKQNDIVVFSGGSSMGKYDFIPEVLEKNGAKFLFEKVKLKPGKPTFFSQLDGKYIFSLPGNPVSSFLTFLLFVTPLIKKYLGQKHFFKLKKFELGQNFFRIDKERKEFIPSKIVENKIFPKIFKNSGHLSAICDVDGFLVVEVGLKKLKKGTVQQFFVL